MQLENWPVTQGKQIRLRLWGGEKLMLKQRLNRA